MSDAGDSCEHYDEAALGSQEPNDDRYDEAVVVNACQSMFITADEDSPVFSLVTTEGSSVPETITILDTEPQPPQSNGKQLTSSEPLIVDQSSDQSLLATTQEASAAVPLDNSNCSQLIECTADNAVDYLHDPDWLNKNEHVFILSTAGKPIYSLHGSEDRLATLFGVLQALVSIFQSNQDSIVSIHAIGIQFAYLVRPPLILVAASRKPLSVQQLQLQLT